MTLQRITACGLAVVLALSILAGAAPPPAAAQADGATLGGTSSEVEATSQPEPTSTTPPQDSRRVPLATVTPPLGAGPDAPADAQPQLAADRRGPSWRRLELPFLATHTVCGDGQGRVYALMRSRGSQTSTLFASDADGQTWRSTPLYGVRAVGCTADDNVYAIHGPKFSVSSDGGHTWEERYADWSLYTADSLALDAAHPERLVVSTSSGTLASLDAGHTWFLSLSGPSSHAVAAQGHVYVVHEGTILKRSADAHTWTDALTATATIDAVAVDPLDGRRVYALVQGDVLASSDGGESWQSFPGASASETWLRLLSIDATGFVYLTPDSSQGVAYRCDPAGACVALPLPVSAREVATLDRITVTLWLGTEAQGPFASPDGGSSWRACASDSMRPPGPVGDMGAYRGRAYLVYDASLLSWGPGDARPQPTDQPPIDGSLVSVAADDRYLYVGTTNGVARWNGVAWESFPLEMDYGYELVALESGLYLKPHSGSVLRRSQDGEPWEDLPAIEGDAETQVQALVDHRAMLYVGTSGGLYRLSEGSWQELGSLPEKEVLALASVGSDLYVAAWAMPPWSGRSLYVSHDGGATWHAWDLGLTRRVNCLGHHGNALYAGTDDGVFAIGPGARRWRALDAGFPAAPYSSYAQLTTVQVRELRVIPSDTGVALLVAAWDGLWVRDPGGRAGPVRAILAIVRRAVVPSNVDKAVLIVGPVDPPEHKTTRSFIDWSERERETLEKAGYSVTTLYFQDATWPNVRAALPGAKVVAYKGHGFGFGEVLPDRTEMGGGLHGFCLYNPDDPSGAQLATQDMLAATTDLAEGAVVTVFACYSGGSSASDTSKVSLELAERRIEGYAFTFRAIGASVYYGVVNEEGILKDLVSHPEHTAYDAYCRVEDCDDLWQFAPLFHPTDVAVFREHSSAWGQALVADPTWTAGVVLPSR
jgi:photosystem II stability/assembly factor-like uncharacterized protein